MRPRPNIHIVDLQAGKVKVKRSELLQRIGEMVTILRNPVEAEALKDMSFIQPIIPYYTVDLHGDVQLQAMRKFISEKLFDGAFRRWSHCDAVLANYIGSDVPLPRVLNDWIRSEHSKFYQAEVEYLLDFSNVLYLPVLPPSGGNPVVFRGARVYECGQMKALTLTSEWLRRKLHFDCNTHVVEYDE